MKNVVVAIALVFGAVAMARAQSSVNTTVTVNAYLAEQTLAWSTAAATLNFGSSGSPILLPASPTIDPTSSSSGAVAIDITGSAGAPVTFTYNTTTTLISATTSTETITYTAEVYGNNTNTQSGATSVGGTTVTLSSGGEFYIWIGGNLGTLPSTTAPGTYTGSYTITAAYGV